VRDVASSVKAHHPVGRGAGGRFMVHGDASDKKDGWLLLRRSLYSTVFYRCSSRWEIKVGFQFAFDDVFNIYQ